MQCKVSTIFTYTSAILTSGMANSNATSRTVTKGQNGMPEKIDSCTKWKSFTGKKEP